MNYILFIIIFDLYNIIFNIKYYIMEYSLISKELTNKLNKSIKKDNGIFFTPPTCINNNLNILKKYINSKVSQNISIKCLDDSKVSQNISIKCLEPSCGSCEYITAINKLYPNINITGIEYNETIYQSISHLNNDKITIYNMDFLKYKTDIKYDLIIGNPPYFVMKKQNVDKSYHKYFEGRPNIFILFIIKCLHLLNHDGILSFVLPKNFLNCLYYNNTRKFIYENYQILDIVDCSNDKYLETQQDTIILIVKNNNVKNFNEQFIINHLKHQEYIIFAPKNNINDINKLFENSKSLWDLGFKVSVGNIVWNQCKNILTDDNTKTRLIYSSDIIDNKLSLKKYNNNEKKNFIDKIGINKPMIVLNRGYGVGEYKFNYCLLDPKKIPHKSFLIENHLICIEYNNILSDDLLLLKFNKILESFTNDKTTKFIELYFGNNAINTTELNYILPIYDLLY